jgi:hypothetical protein
MINDLINQDFIMTAILERCKSENLWGRFCNWITSIENLLYIGWFCVLTLLVQHFREFSSIKRKF